MPASVLLEFDEENKDFMSSDTLGIPIQISLLTAPPVTG
jgi:hypothetical protein